MEEEKEGENFYFMNLDKSQKRKRQRLKEVKEDVHSEIALDLSKLSSVNLSLLGK